MLGGLKFEKKCGHMVFHLHQFEMGGSGSLESLKNGSEINPQGSSWSGDLVGGEPWLANGGGTSFLGSVATNHQTTE